MGSAREKRNFAKHWAVSEGDYKCYFEIIFAPSLSRDEIFDRRFTCSQFCDQYTGCPGGNVPDFGRMFLTLKYTDITQNTYIRS